MQRIFPVTMLLFALLIASTAFAQENNDAKKLYNDGNAKLKSGDFSGAVQMYDQALGLEKHQFYYYQRGIALRKSGKETDAIESFKAAVTLAPKFAPAYNALGSGYFKLKDYNQAITYYEKALVEKPNLRPAKKGLAAANTALANEKAKAGDLEGAIASALKAVEADPKYATAYVVLAQSYNKASKYKQAIEAGNNALKRMRTKKGAAHFEIGLAHRNLGDTKAAIKAFTQAKKDATYARSAKYELEQLK